MRTLSTMLLLAGLAACGDDAGSHGQDAASEEADGGLGGVIDGGGDGAVRVEASVGSDAATCGAEEKVAVGAPTHVAGGINYPDRPPAGGSHDPCWGSWGVHDTELADERFVHNLEHGGVVFLYHCPEGCPAEVQTLSNFVRTQSLAILTPYAALPTRFGVVSWGYRLLSDCLDRAQFEAFYRTHRNQGLESISAEPSGSCL